MKGRDKLAELVDGVPLLRRQAMRAIEAGYRVHVALPVVHSRESLLDGLDVVRLPIEAAAEGMGGTLRAGVALLPDAPRFALMPADLPELTTEDLRTVLEISAFDPDMLVWRGASATGRPGHPVICDGSLKADFAKLKGDAGGRRILTPLAGRTRLVPLPGDHATRDLDTPDDWASWRAGRDPGLPG